MKFTTAISSLLLAALTPAVAGQNLLGIVAIVNSGGLQTVFPASQSCFAYPGGPTIARLISIDPLPNAPPIRCTFFTSSSCDGDQITLNTGQHEFTRDLWVGSWQCVEQV